MNHALMSSRQNWKAFFSVMWIFSLILLTSPVSGQNDPEFTPYDVARLRYVDDVQISPDGTRIAYALIIQRNPFKESDGAAWYELHVVDTEGNSRPYVTGEIRVSEIRWTPDGSHISFLAESNDDDTQCLYRIPLAGGEAKKVLEHETDITAYSWSPDGDQVAFLAKEAKGEQEKELGEKGFNQEIFEEDWRPVQVWIAEVTAETPDKRVLDLPGSASELHWSPAGGELALALAPTSLIDDHYMYRRVKIIDVESGEIITEIQNPGKLGEVAWNPTGEYLALISGIDIHDPREGRLKVANATNGELNNILPDYQGHVSSVAWKDENTIVYIGDENVRTTFNQIRRDGSGQSTLIPTEGPVFENFSIDADGQAVAFDAESPQHPDEVYYSNMGSSVQRLTRHNPWLARKQFGEQEVVRWKARDGLELCGILIKPVNWNENTRYPLILSVHGGPESHDVNGWLTSYADPGQVGASQGFAVFYPNYRGSTGRGVEFSRLSQNDPAGKEFDDLVDAVDHFVDTGLADNEKIGITGGSYGGYASAWCATHYSDRFAASVMVFGISDKISKTGTSDIPWELYLVHDSTWPWEDWQHFLEASPMYYVEQAETPLLITHGEEDTRVHPGQSLELHRFLKVRNAAPVRLVFYPDEGHGYGYAAHRLDHNLRIMRWMNHYLEGPGGTPPAYQLEYQQEQFE